MNSPLPKVPFLLMVSCHCLPSSLEWHWRAAMTEMWLSSPKSELLLLLNRIHLPSNLGVPADLEAVGVGGGGGQKKVSLWIANYLWRRWRHGRPYHGDLGPSLGYWTLPSLFIMAMSKEYRVWYQERASEFKSESQGALGPKMRTHNNSASHKNVFKWVIHRIKEEISSTCNRFCDQMTSPWFCLLRR